MDLNGLQFTQEQLAELYTDALVVTDGGMPSTSSKKTSAPAKPGINFKGQNKKGVLWLVHEPAHTFLDDDDFEFLSQIVGACKMNMDDIALVNLAHVEQSVTEVVEALKPSIVLLCGIEYQQLPFKLDEYILYPHANRNYFLADRLQDLRNDKAKKSKLWLALKAMFSL
jgi:hypothetical protein